MIELRKSGCLSQCQKVDQVLDVENGKYDIQLSTLFHIFEALGRKIKLTII